VSIAASKSQYGESLLLAFRGGAVSAALSAAFCICGVTVLYLVCHLFFVQVIGAPSTSVPMMLAGYGFGASFVALFMQLGGGIYTKAADVGADMIGKVESNIPEDDPRNPAVIADLVGDNVGDCAGSMADIFESIAGEVIGTMILGSTLAHEGGLGGAIDGYMFFPLVVHAFDLIISGFGILTMHVRGDEDPLEPMKRSYVHCMGIAIVIFWATARFMLHTPVAPDAWWHFALCGMVGIVMSYLLILSTQYYTDYKHDPVKSIARASLTGHGTNVIQGIAVGLESCGFPVLIIVAGLLSSYTLGSTSGLPSIQAGIYGTAVATMGMLCTAVFVLSMNNFGPIADNAGGIVEMSEQPDHIRKITDRLDAVGNVTKAASKGYAVGGSALACFVLFQAFLDEISLYIGSHYGNVNIARMEVMLGGILGIMMIFVFTGWAMSSVGRTAQEVVWEVRNQFKEFPGIMAGTQKPDYNRCVSIVTKAALKEMIKPAVLALGAPISVGLFFRYVGYLKGEKMLGVEVVASFVIFATLTGLLMAIFMDNAGGAWDNAKKYIESQDKKGSEEHKAAVTGDTVGDPFKDTAGPSLHVIIATMSTTVLVLGPLFINQ
jgi:inorganic pyrophosphatase